MVKSLFILWLGLFAVASQAISQQGSVRGQVIDQSGRQPVPFVYVSVDSLQLGVLADDQGRWRIDVDAGMHLLTFSRIGFTSLQHKVRVSPDSVLELSTGLSQLSILSDEVLVTASRKSQVLNLAPASASVVTAAQLANRQIQTFDQALEDVPGILLSRSGGANVQSLSIRGASETAGGGVGNRVLLLIDGRPALSPESGGALWNLVPVNALERIEVVKGAYSALYGSSAMGGVINAITREPQKTSETHLQLSYGFYEQQAQDFEPEYRDYKSVHFSRSRKLGRFGYVVDAGTTRNDGHRAKSAFELYNLYTKFAYEFAPNRTLKLTANHNSLKNDTPATWFSSLQPFEVADFRKDDTQQKQETSFDLFYSAITNSNVKYSSRFYFYQNFQQFSFNDDPLNDSTNVNFGKQFVDRSMIRARRVGNVTQVDVSLGESHYALAGIDVKLDNTVARPDSVLYGEHEALEVGVFVQDEWEASDEITVTLGARLDYFSLRGDFKETNFSPKLAFVYQPFSRLSIRGLFARAFRTPSIAERFIKFEQGGGLAFTPNPDLVAEKLTLSTEFGSNLQINDRLTVDAAVYYNNYKDLISFIQVSAPTEPLTFKVVNLKRAVMSGVDIGVHYRPCSWFNVRAGYAFLDARDTSPERFNDALAYKARHTVSLSTVTDYRKWRLAANFRSRSRIEEVFIYPDSTPAGYATIDLKLIYAFSKDASVALSGLNLNNAQYEELERYRMPGRSYSLGLRVKL